MHNSWLGSKWCVGAGLVALLGGVMVSRPHMALAQAAATEAPAAKKVDQAAQSIFETMMQAFIEDDYSSFQAFGDDSMRAGLTKDVFEKSVTLLAPHLKAGYGAEYLATLDKKGTQLYLWKLTFKDGNEEMVCNMMLKGPKVVAFFVL